MIFITFLSHVIRQGHKTESNKGHVHRIGLRHTQVSLKRNT